MIKIQVTQEHIDRAFNYLKKHPEEYYSCNCPIALAATEYFKEEYGSDGYSVYRGVAMNRSDIFTIINRSEARRFVTQFDYTVMNGGYEKPISKPITIQLDDTK